MTEGSVPDCSRHFDGPTHGVESFIRTMPATISAAAAARVICLGSASVVADSRHVAQEPLNAQNAAA